MEVYVYMMSVNSPLTPSEEEDLRKRLSEERQNKIDKLRFEADKRLSLGAGILLDYGLKRYGLRERSEEFAKIENGKPVLKNHPDIQFNLSHSGDMVMAAFTKDCPLGCDVERRQSARMDVAKRFFAPSEQRVLMAAGNGEKRDLLFSRLWTLKESYIKAGGQGMAMALDSFAVELGTSPRILGPDAPFYRFQEFSLPGYCASVCVKRQDPAKGVTFFFSFQNLQDMV